MLKLIETIKSLAEQANWNIDIMDIGCTITNAMNQEQVDDLKAMAEYLQGHAHEKVGGNFAEESEIASYVLSNIMHDLNGLKAAYFCLPASDCFMPRSAGYSKKVAS